MPKIVINNQREFLMEWIKRLRSGDYEQGQGALRRRGFVGNNKPDTFCCLGVGCEIGVDSGMLVRMKGECLTYDYVDVRHLDEVNFKNGCSFPIVFLKWLLEKLPEFNQNILIEWNDTFELDTLKNESFAEIADYIESTLLPQVQD